MIENNIVLECRNYLESIGVNKERIDNDFKDIYQVYFNLLPKVCILKENRNGGGNQTHIHVTGLEGGMKFFYDSKVLENITPNLGEDVKEELYIYSENLSDLNDRAIMKLGFDKKLNIQKSVDLIKSYTYKKIGRIGTPSIQVQLSKIRQDDEQFMNLRRCLFEKDGLIFLKKVTGEKIVMGIPYEIINEVIHDKKNYFEEVEIPLNNRDNPNTFRMVDYSSIATYSPNDEDELKENFVDLSSGIATRKLRTERHQAIVKLLAIDLERKGYKLYEYPVDCLAINQNNKGLLFEIKTLDGTESDEKKQVLKAFSQLCYYEKCYVKNKFDVEVEKVVLFESKIGEEHIDFFNEYGIKVLWVNKNKVIESVNGLFLL